MILWHYGKMNGNAQCLDDVYERHRMEGFQRVWWDIRGLLREQAFGRRFTSIAGAGCQARVFFFSIHLQDF
jgi:hypothetical protein